MPHDIMWWGELLTALMDLRADDGAWFGGIGTVVIEWLMSLLTALATACAGGLVRGPLG